MSIPDKTAPRGTLQTESVAALLHPKSIAIVGASPKAGGWTRSIAANLQRFEFAMKGE